MTLLVLFAAATVARVVSSDFLADSAHRRRRARSRARWRHAVRSGFARIPLWALPFMLAACATFALRAVGSPCAIRRYSLLAIGAIGAIGAIRAIRMGSARSAIDAG